MKIPSIFCILLALAIAPPARAETAEVAKGVEVTKTTFAAPINEQPFFGFADKTPELRAIDDKFVSSVVDAAGSREKAYEAAVQRAWTFIAKNEFADAAKRFNQAYLLLPEQSAIYHGFAVIAIARFNDPAFADELFQRALIQPQPLKALKADYGRFLLVAKRPKDAQPVLEQAVRDTPDFPDAWSNLAYARLQNGDAKAACIAADQADKLRPSINVAADLKIIRRQAPCG